MLSFNDKYGLTVEKVIDNSNNMIGPALISAGSNLKAPVISGESRVFQSGDIKLIEEISTLISQTKEILCVSSFLIQESAITRGIQECQKRGVRVYILTAGEKQLSDPSEDDKSTMEERKRASRELLINLGSKSLIKTGDNLHSKFIISDPKTNPRAILLTSNLTVRALNENLELAVELSGNSARELFRQFVSGFWVLAVRTLSSSNKNETTLKVTKNHPEFSNKSYVPKEIKWTFNEQSLLKDTILDLIDKSKKSISFSAWTINYSHPVTKRIIEKLTKGVKVTVFTRLHRDNLEFLKHLVSNGGSAYCHDLLHAKSLIVDDESGLVMTANISRLGLDEGYETAVTLNKDQVEVIRKVHEEWKTRATFASVSQLKLKDVTRQWVNLNKDTKIIDPPKEMMEKSLGKINVSDIRDYFDKNLKLPNNIQTFDSLRTKYIAVLFPPILPDKAKRKTVEISTNLEIYSDSNQNYVCIRDLDEYNEALKIFKELKAKIVFLGK